MNRFILLFETNALIEWGGFFLIVLLVFAETGLLLGLVIPGGETLVFTAGLMASTGLLDVSIFMLLVALVIAGVAGDLSGFFIGRRIGRRLYEKKDTWYFKKQYLVMAESFLRRHKKRALIIGKFLPVIRPFSPLMSGATHIKSGVFIPISLLSCFLYMCTFSLAGYFLGSRFPQLVNYLVWLVPISILFSIITIISQVGKQKARLQQSGVE